MPTDPLDDRIRSMMSDAMSSAPPAPSLSLRAPVPAGPARRGLLWVGIGIAACVAAVAALVWTSGDDDHAIVGASTTTPATEPSLPWPDGLAVIVATPNGIEKVTSENGQAVVTRVLDGVHVARAIELQDGSIVYQESGGDIRHISPDGEVQPSALVTDDGSGSTLLDDADAPNGQLRLVYRTPTTDPSASFDLGVWFQPDEPRHTLPPGGFGVGYGRFTIVSDSRVVSLTIDDTGQRGVYGWSTDGQKSTDGLDDVLAVAGDGSGSLAFMNADGRVSTSGVRSGLIAILDSPADVRVMDYRTDWLGVSRLDGSMQVIDTVSGTEYDVPIERGDVTISRKSAPTPTTGLPTSVPHAVTAGANGVWEFGPDGDVQWTKEPMSFALMAPDGSMLMQRESGGDPSTGWTQADTLPLRQASPGARIEDLFGSLFPAADVVPGWYTLHDAAMVGARPLVILDRHADLVNIESPPGALLVLDLDAASLVQIGEVGGWEAGLSRLHLAMTGVIVGERYDEAVRSYFSVRVDGSAATTAADLGLERSYVDCNDCPRLYTISRDGSTLAWLEGTHIERRSLFGGDFGMPSVELGDLTGAPLEATNLSISAEVAVYDRNLFFGAATPPIVVYLDGDTPRAEELGAGTRSALP